MRSVSRRAGGVFIIVFCVALGCPRQDSLEEVGEPRFSNRHSEKGQAWRLHRDFCHEGRVASQAERDDDLETRPEVGPGYGFSLEAGEFLALDVEQLGVDVVVEIWQRDSNELVLRIDSPTGMEGTEEVVLFADTSSDYVLYAMGSARDGWFRARVRALRAASGEDRALADAWYQFSQAELGRRSSGEIETAAELYRSAIGQWSSLGLTQYEARGWENLGLLFYQNTETRARSVAAYEAALALHRDRGDSRRQGRLLHRLARSWAKLDSHDRAAALYRASLEIWTDLGEKREQASVLNDLANALDRMGDLHLAIEAYSMALDRWQSLGLRAYEATTRTNLGRLYMSVGNRRQAVRHYQAALRLVGGGTTNRARPWILTRLGDALLRLDGPATALRHYREALDWSLEAGDRRSEALALNSIGQAEKKAQRPAAAVASYRRALALYQDEGDALAEVIVKSNLAAAYEALGQTDQARELFEEALEQAVAADAMHTLLEIHQGLARIEKSRGCLQMARAHLDQALEVLQALRERVTRIDMRSSFLAIRLDILELMVSVLVDLAAENPEAGYVEEALHVTERLRSEGFLDELRVPCRHDQIDQASRSKLSALAERINSLHYRSRHNKLGEATVPVRRPRV